MQVVARRMRAYAVPAVWLVSLALLPSLSFAERDEFVTRDHLDANPVGSAQSVYISDIEILDAFEAPEDGITHDSIGNYLSDLYDGFSKAMTLEEMREVAEALTSLYQSKGYAFTRAYVAPQELSDGLLTVKVLPGILSGVKFVGETHYSLDRLSEPFAELVDKPLHIDRLEEALTLINNFPGLKLVGYFSRGKNLGEAYINIKVEEEIRQVYKLRLDNYGQDTTGEYRTFVDLSLNNPFNLADVFDVSVQHSADPGNNVFGSISYRVPFLDNKLSAQVQAYRSEYTVGDELSALSISGYTSALGLNLNYRIKNTPTAQYGVKAAFDYKQLNTSAEIAEIEASATDSDYWRVSVSADGFVREIVGDLSVLGLLEAFHGNFTSSNSADDEETSDSFSGLSLYGFGVYPIGVRDPRWYSGSLEVTLNGQYSADVLPSPERGGITGVYSVRAYDSGLFFGDSSAHLAIEYHPLKLRYDYQLASIKSFLFYDFAYAAKNSDEDSLDSADTSAWASFSGGGLGIRVNYSDFFSARIQLAQPAEEKGLVRDDFEQDATISVDMALEKRF